MDPKIPITSRYSRVGCSTGRGTRLKHSTGMDWDEWEKTGEDGRIIHSTEAEFDKKVKHKRNEDEDNLPGLTASQCRRMSAKYKKADKSKSGDDGDRYEISPEALKKVIIDY